MRRWATSAGNDESGAETQYLVRRQRHRARCQRCLISTSCRDGFADNRCGIDTRPSMQSAALNLTDNNACMRLQALACCQSRKRRQPTHTGAITHFPRQHFPANPTLAIPLEFRSTRLGHRAVCAPRNAFGAPWVAATAVRSESIDRPSSMGWCMASPHLATKLSPANIGRRELQLTLSVNSPQIRTGDADRP